MLVGSFSPSSSLSGASEFASWSTDRLHQVSRCLACRLLLAAVVRTDRPGVGVGGLTSIVLRPHALCKRPFSFAVADGPRQGRNVLGRPLSLYAASATVAIARTPRTMQAAALPSDLVGNTPLLDLSLLLEGAASGCKLDSKLESLGLCSSVKYDVGRVNGVTSASLPCRSPYRWYAHRCFLPQSLVPSRPYRFPHLSLLSRLWECPTFSWLRGGLSRSLYHS